MDITKCDICKKTKKEKYPSLNEKSKWISLSLRGRGEWLSVDLCGKCSDRLQQYIKRYLKIKETKTKK